MRSLRSAALAIALVCLSLSALATTTAHATWIDFTVVGDGSTSSSIAAEVTITIDHRTPPDVQCGPNSNCIERVIFDLTSGSDTNAYGANYNYSNLSSGVGSGEVTFNASDVDGGEPGGDVAGTNWLTFDFDAKKFDPTEIFVFTIDIGQLSDNSGGAFGIRDVFVQVMLEDGSYGSSTFHKDNGYTSTASVFIGVPEPSTLALFGIGLMGFGVLRRRTRSA